MSVLSTSYSWEGGGRRETEQVKWVSRKAVAFAFF